MVKGFKTRIKSYLYSAGLALLLTGGAAIYAQAQTATPTANPSVDPAQTLPYLLQVAATGNTNGRPANIAGLGTLSVKVSGATAGSATISFQASNDRGASYQNQLCANSSTGALTSSTTVDGNFVCGISGLDTFIAPITNFSSGTINVTANGFYPPQGGAVLGATSNVVLSATSPASASTVAGTPSIVVGPYRSMQIYAHLQGATGGTLDVYLQTSPDQGTTWTDYAHFAQLTAGASAIDRVWAVSKSAQQTTLQTVGTGTSPALAASTIVGGDWGDRIRTVFVAGVSTSVGAAQTIKLTLTS